ncbi:alpha/beta hydrolase family protein [Maribacter sp. HTCC2170]|uniref:alpha/beta hydrolase family protein n=1 Tax=Maribacter sp. (strain HTCC2170 / KCCM 42371) TaxID=313603 RepID=UPI00006BB869|nr:alpha/beta hydrolase [Maribacter sp. HTCC2170]EAQ99703.1 lipoprotein, putative [Maribacter sp. HTCC2170]
MKRIIIVFIAFGIFSCDPNSGIKNDEKTGNFSGIFKHGNFSDKILFEIERDSVSFNVLFTSLEQNANRIPFQGIESMGDSINFKLQSDFYTYSFRNKWIEDNSKLQGALTVDSITVPYTLEKELPSNNQNPKNEDVSFESNELKINGTIWYPKNEGNKGIVILTSSGNADRSASRAEAKLFAQRGFTTFHYDKRGTGNSEGDWQIATIEELVEDDINAIKFFSDKTGISLTNIGIKGSSQGATKIPYVLNELESLEYGVAVSCPGVSLLESDLNYWKNRNAETIGNEIEAATKFQRKVFEFIAGKLSRTDLEKAIDNAKSNSWFANVWVPNLDEVQIDKKLLYSPISYFQRTKQPILILQGTRDEIIPANSHEIISAALAKSDNDNYKNVLLEGASHSMYKIGESDFPYWSKLHPDYLGTIEDWINTVSNNVYTK